MTDCWNVLERPPPGAEVHLVRAERSDRCAYYRGGEQQGVLEGTPFAGFKGV